MALAAAVPAFSQNDTTANSPDFVQIAKDLKEDIKDAVKQEDGEYSPVIAESPDGMFKLYSSSHIGYGVYSTRSSDFIPALSGEFFVNLIRFGFYPWQSLSFELNLDFGLNSIKSRGSVLTLDSNREVIAYPNGEILPEKVKKPRSTLEFFSFNLPFLVKYGYENFTFGFGTEVSLNLGGRVTHKYTSGYDTFSVVEKRAGINRFTYAVVGSVAYKDLCLFVKIYPRYSGILSNRKIDMTYMSMGLSFGL